MYTESRVRRLRTATRVLALSMLILAAVAFASCTTTEDAKPFVEDPSSHPFRADLDVFARELPRRHIDLFFELTPNKFAAMVHDLDSCAPGLTEAEFALELRRILAAVGDAHTNLSFDFTRVYPFSFKLFEEGIYCTRALPEHEEAIGMRLVTVDGTSVEHALRLAREITPHDNESQIRMMAPIYLMMPELLAAAGITGGPDEATFAFVDDEGEPYEIVVPAQPPERLGDLADDPYPRPLSRKNPGAYYWFETDPSRELVYLQYNVCLEDETKPMAEFTERFMGEIRSARPRHVVIDLRYNTGGSSPVLHPLISELAVDATHGRPYELSVVIGRETFSSAVLNAIRLRRDADARFVGEPSGGRPNHYGEVRSFRLPNTGCEVKYSTKYFTHYRPDDGSDPDTLVPDIEAIPTWNAYVRGIDVALEAIVESRPSAGTR